MTAEEKVHVWTPGRVVFGIVLSFAFCFLAVSIVTYSPKDPPSQTYTALQQPVHNMGGAPGAYCAGLLYRFCGYGVWFLLAALFLRLISFWRLPRPGGSVLKVFGTVFMLTALCGALSAFMPRYTHESDAAPSAEKAQEGSALAQRLAAQQTELGPGGQLGAAARFLLDKRLHIAPAGIGIFFLFMFAAGVILASDSPLLHAILQVTGLRAAAEIFVPGKLKHNPPAQPVPEDESDLGETEMSEPEQTGEADGPETQDEEEFPGEDVYDEEEEEVPAPYVLPPMEILPYSEPVDQNGADRRIEAEMRRLQKAFDDYSCDVRVVDHQNGPVITQFELELSKGQKLAQIQSLSNELAIAMKVPSVRIVFPIPGKSSVGVEIPNKDRQFVRLRDVMEESAESAAKMQIPLFIGKDVTGDPIVTDLAKLPHLLIAGRTGTGKSVCLNSIILSILMTKTPAQIRLVMIDPKMVELSPYKKIPHLMYPVLTDMKQATTVLHWLCEKMDERYNLLAKVGVRQLKEYNRLTPKKLYQRYQPQSEEEWERVPKQMPAIVVIADEMADMMAIAGKDVQEYIARLAAKSRAVGIHLILATQKPTVDVVTGLIKSNLPARIAFGVATQSDSRVILDANGAEKLLGNGDLLFHDSVTNQTIRGQGTYIDDDEIYAVNCEIAVDKPDFVEIETDEGTERVPVKQRCDDPLYEQAVEMILTERRGSTSLLQRRFSIGYGRAAKIIDAMEAEGLIGPKTENDSKPRKVLKSLEEWLAEKQGEEVPPAPTPRAFIPPSETAAKRPVRFSEESFDGADESGEESGAGRQRTRRLYPARPRPSEEFSSPSYAEEDGVRGDEPADDEEWEEEYSGEDYDDADGGTGADSDEEEYAADEEEYSDDGQYIDEEEFSGEEEDPAEYGLEETGEWEEEEETWEEEFLSGETPDEPEDAPAGQDGDGGFEEEIEEEIEEEPRTEAEKRSSRPPGKGYPSAERHGRPRPDLRELARRRKFRKKKRREEGRE